VVTKACYLTLIVCTDWLNYCSMEHANLCAKRPEPRPDKEMLI